MSYTVREMFVTLQGEGLNAGRKALFVRFAGCNLWSGREADRDRGKGACSKWCDTDFFKGDKYVAQDLVNSMGQLWPTDDGFRLCVLTGGEPGLQFDRELYQALQTDHWEIAVETNGTIENRDLIGFADHICVSPKLGELSVRNEYLRNAAELKIVLPGGTDGRDWSDRDLHGMAEVCGGALYVQPLDPAISTAVEDTWLHPKSLLGRASSPAFTSAGDKYQANVKRCIDWVQRNPGWRLSLQQHKTIGLR